MANQPELPVYDAGIYQLEIIDPVDGGVGAVSNKPLLSLANRTAYLKQHVDALDAGTFIPPTVAPLDSPSFTGTPTLQSSPAIGDNSTNVPTTAFVQGTVNGITTKSVAGGANVTLTAIEAGRGTLKFTGALTANISVIVPAPTGQWTVWNATTGAFTLTIKTAAGSGVAVTQGKSVEVFSDGTNVQLQTNDFVNVALTGTPTTPTPTAGDNSTKVSNTAFVTAAVNAITSGFAALNGSASQVFAVAPATASNQAVQFGQLTGVVGLVRNLSMRLTSAGSAIVVAAAEVQVESILIGGLKATIAGLNVTFDGTHTGANGMDTGSLPVSGFVGIYAIYNPTTSTEAVLGVNASSLLNETYTGANMPSGYTMSALLTVLPTNASGLIVPCTVTDRSVDIVGVTAMSTNTVAATPTMVNNLAVPLNAKSFSGSITAANSAAGTVTLTVYSSIAGTGAQDVGIATTGAASNKVLITRMKLSTSQRMFYSSTVNTGTPTYTVVVNSYEI
jgi:hypothetical protein